jgi:hypothetical protein
MILENNRLIQVNKVDIKKKINNNIKINKDKEDKDVRLNELNKIKKMYN